MIEPASRQDIEFLRTPKAGQDREDLAKTPFVAARLPLERARNAHVARSGVEVHPAMFDKFAGVGIPIPVAHVGDAYARGVTPSCPGYLWNGARTNPLVIGLIRDPGTNVQPPEIPPDLLLKLRDENGAIVNLNGSSLLRNAESRQENGAALRIHPTGRVVVNTRTDWYDTDGIVVKAGADAKRRNQAQAPWVIHF